MKWTTMFRCDECGCMTPAIACVADDTAPDRQLELSADCAHCGEELTRTTTLAQDAPETPK